MTAPPENILVIKHGALGDIVQAMDAFASLRAGHPDAHLAVLTTKPFAPWLASAPWFDQVIIDDRAPFYHIRAWFRLRQMFRSGWTRIYDFQCSRRTASYFRHFITSPQTEFIGKAHGASHPLPDFAGINNRDRMVVTAKLGGCPETLADLSWMGNAAHGLALPARYAVLLPGCSPAKPSKRWPAAHYAALARCLQDKGLTAVLAGTQHDQQAIDAVMALNPDCVSIMGKTSIDQISAVFRQAAAVCGNDTGPVFLAARMQVPTVMVMGSDTDPTMSAPVGEHAGWVRHDNIADVTANEVMARFSTLGGI